MKNGLMIYFSTGTDKLAVTYRQKMLVRAAILATLAYEGYGQSCEVSVTFTDDEGIHAVNREYRGIDKPTDVLSFPLTDFERTEEPVADEPTLSLGDIVVSLERAAAQAEEFGHSADRELAFLCVHSTLHLLGYDHELSDADDEDMRRRQREILDQMGMKVN
jgi:probable rRNA maturation factor